MVPRRRRRPVGVMRRLTLIIAGLLLAAIGALLAGGAILTAVGPEQAVQRLATLLAGRPVAIGRLAVAWTDPIRIEISDLSLANVAGGTATDMIRIGRMAAVIDLGALARGRLRYETLQIERAEIALERLRDGDGNWTFGRDGHPMPAPTVLPTDRTRFPILFRATVRDSRITYDNGNGRVLAIGLDRVHVLADDEHAPATIEGEGRYNDVPVRLSARTGSLAALRDGGAPFPVTIGMTDRTGARLDFAGTLAEPLEADGARGRLVLHVPDIGRLAGQFGAALKLDADLAFGGELTRRGNAWRLDDANGTFMAQAIGGWLRLDEGARGRPDSFAIDLQLAELDVNALLQRMGGDKAGSGEFDLTIDDGPAAPRIAGTLRVGHLTYGPAVLQELMASGQIGPGERVLDDASAKIAGGTVRVMASARSMPAGTALALNLLGRDLALATLFAAAGTDAPLLDGRVDVQANLHGAAPGLAPLLAGLNGQAVVTLDNGTIAARAVEQATTDLRSLFRRRDDLLPLHCMLAVISFRDGQGELGPARLRTPAGEVHAVGTVSLPDTSVDLIVQGRRSGSLALDLPIRVRGSILAPSTDLSAREVPDPVLLPALPAALAEQAQASPCRW